MQDKILNTKLLIYICEGTESEIKEWFKTINIAGVPLNEQELLNAIYSGKFVTAAKKEFSNSQNSNIQKWSTYIKGDVKRQDFFACALDWVSKGNKETYMSEHRNSDDISELKNYFTSVIDWISSVFKTVEKEMCGLEWGELYEKYHANPYSPDEVDEKVKELYADGAVKIAAEFLSMFSADARKQNCSISAFLRTEIKESSTKNRQKKQRKKYFQLPILCHLRHSEQNKNMETCRDGCRPCCSLEQRRRDKHRKLSNALPVA